VDTSANKEMKAWRSNQRAREIGATKKDKNPFPVGVQAQTEFHYNSQTLFDHFYLLFHRN
jgi:hypothetical protein